METALVFGTLFITVFSLWLILVEYKVDSQEKDIRNLIDNFSVAVKDNQELLRLSLGFLLKESIKNEDFEQAERYKCELQKLDNLFKK